MSNSSWESSRNQLFRLWRAALIAPALFVLMHVAVARPIPGKSAQAAPNSAPSGSAVTRVGAADSGISGTIVDSATGAPISGGQVIVALEQPDGTGTDTIFTQASPDVSGRFSFSPLPLATTFDVVAVAISGSGVAYNATVVVGVPSSSTDVGAIPLVAESGESNGPARIEGIVTASSGSAPSLIRAAVSAVQTINLRGGLSISVDVPQTVTISSADYRPVTIPGESGTSANVFIQSASGCPASTPNANCARYVIVVPRSNPSVGFFAAGKFAYQPPTSALAHYSVRANAFMPYGTGASVCLPSFQSATIDAHGQPLQIAPDGSATAQTIAFTGCW